MYYKEKQYKCWEWYLQWVLEGVPEVIRFNKSVMAKWTNFQGNGVLIDLYSTFVTTLWIVEFGIWNLKFKGRVTSPVLTQFYLITHRSLWPEGLKVPVRVWRHFRYSPSVAFY